MLTKGEKISKSKSEIRKKKILEYIKTKKRFNDYIITKYLGYEGSAHLHPHKTTKNLGHQIKIKCVKCGYEYITSSHIFFVKQNQKTMYKCSVNENHKILIPKLNLKNNNYLPYYKEKYSYMWINMNFNCHPDLSRQPKCRYVEKGIKVYENWRFYKSTSHNVKNINAKNYLNYEKFIDSLLETNGFSIEDIKNKTIRIERIDKHDDFKPSNLGIRVFKQKKLLSINGEKNAKY